MKDSDYVPTYHVRQRRSGQMGNHHIRTYAVVCRRIDGRFYTVSSAHQTREGAQHYADMLTRRDRNRRG